LDKKRFSDFAVAHQPLDGTKCSINEVLNREIQVLGYKLKESKYRDGSGSGQCLTLQFELDGDRMVLFTGSQVLSEQIQAYQHEIPFYATIKKIDRFFTLS